MKSEKFKIEKEKILDQIVGGRCYYFDVKIWMHPFAIYLVYFSKRLNITPNFLSFANLFTSILCLIFFLTNNFIASFLLFWIRAILDCSDGALARYANQTSDFGKLLDSLIDWPFYIILWLLIAIKISNLYLSLYFLTSVFLYVLLVEYFIEPKLKKLKNRAPLKNYFLKNGFILGFGVFSVIEFWSLAFFAYNSTFAINNIYLLVILTNLDLVYRLYEVIRYK